MCWWSWRQTHNSAPTQPRLFAHHTLPRHSAAPANDSACGCQPSKADDTAVQTTIQIIQSGIPIARCELLDANAIRGVQDLASEHGGTHFEWARWWRCELARRPALGRCGLTSH